MSGFDYGDKKPNGQYQRYPSLPAEARQTFVRPIRCSYKHLKCGTVTSMAQHLAETYAARPSYYGATFCAHCQEHLAVAEFVWIEADGSEGPKVGT